MSVTEPTSRPTMVMESAMRTWPRLITSLTSWVATEAHLHGTSTPARTGTVSTGTLHYSSVTWVSRVPNHRHIDYLFNSWFRLTTKKTTNIRITSPLCYRWIPLRGTVIRKTFPCNDVTMGRSKSLCIILYDWLSMLLVGNYMNPGYFTLAAIDLKP